MYLGTVESHSQAPGLECTELFGTTGLASGRKALNEFTETDQGAADGCWIYHRHGTRKVA